jgi:hypothetical protein
MSDAVRLNSLDVGATFFLGSWSSDAPWKVLSVHEYEEQMSRLPLYHTGAINTMTAEVNHFPGSLLVYPEGKKRT